MDSVLATLDTVVAAMPNFAAIFVLLLLAKLFYDKTTPYGFDEELVEKDNAAFGVCLAGYLVGVGIALTGALFGTGGDLGEDMVTLLIGGVATILLMRLSVLINDKLILRHFSVDKELIQDRNVGTGFVVGGSCVATGFMLNGVLSGQSSTLAAGIVDIGIYWAVGQAILIVGSLVFQLITSYDIHKVIEDDDNVAAGISFGGFLVALGIITRGALAGATSNLGEEILTTLIFAAFGILFLVCGRIIADRVFLPRSSLSKEVAVDRNPAAGAIAAACFICVALLLSTAINPGATPELEEGEETVVETVVEPDLPDELSDELPDEPSEPEI